MAKGFFITGTDTGVGKTVITGALILLIKHLRFRVCGMKPIETGCLKSKFKVKEEVLMPPDGMFLKKMAGMDESIDLLTPIRLKNPLAPFPASEIEGIPVAIEKIKKAYAELSKKYDVVVVEGIGGLLVPITATRRGRAVRRVGSARWGVPFDMLPKVDSMAEIRHPLVRLEPCKVMIRRDSQAPWGILPRHPSIARARRA